MPIIFTNGQGKIYDIPEDKVEEAIKGGLEPGFEMRNKEGKQYVVPKSKFDEAVKGGLIHEPIWQAKQDSDKAYVESEKKRLDSGLGKVESAARGVVDTATFGQGKHMAGLLRTPEEKAKIAENYELSDQASRDVNPYSHIGGQLVAGLPTLFAPVGGVKAGLQSVGVGAVEGAVRNAEKGLEEAAEGALEGAAWGSIPLGLDGLKYAKNAAKWGAKKGASALTQLPEETLEHYYARNKQVRSAPKLEAVAKEVVGSVKGLADDVSRESGDAFRILERNKTQVPKSEFMTSIQDSIDFLKRSGGGPERKAEINYLQGILDDAKGVPGEMLDGGWVKNTIKGMYDRTTLPGNAAEILPDIAKSTRMASGRINNQSLKPRDLEYAEYMEGLAQKADLLDRVKTPFGKNEQAYNSLKGIAREKAPFKAETLADLESMTGKELANKARDAAVADAFKGKSTNGSRNVNLGANAGGVVGAVIGYLADTLVRPGVAKGIDAVKYVESIMPELDKYGPVLKKAAQKGGNYFLMTHRLLMEKDENYRDLIESK